MMRSDEPDTRPDLGSAWAGFYRDLETRNSYYDRLYKYGQPFNAETGQYISIAGMPFRQAVSLTCQPADLLKQTLCLAYSPPHASSETSNSSTFPPDTLPFVDSAPPPPHEYEHFLGSLLADTASDIPLPALGKKQRSGAHSKRRAAKRSTESHSSLPQLSPAEIAQAKEDGLVFARVGNYAAWPAQMQRATAEQLHLLNDRADSSPADRVFVVFYGKHDFNMVSQSRINMSFEDGLRKCKLKKGSALEEKTEETGLLWMKRYLFMCQSVS
ncbi:hypothetical protein WJX79_002650 [Trebouxia sp. C0005]